METSDLLRALQEIDKRAERTPDEYVISTYVDEPSLVGALFASDNGVVFGRRGTGKTHALKYLAEIRRQMGDFVVYIDMEQDIGSTEGRYVDQTLSVEERATRLVVDILSIVHERLLEDAFEGDTTVLIDTFDRALDHFSEVVVVKEVEQTTQHSDSISAEGAAGLTLSVKPSLTLNGKDNATASTASGSTTKIHFGGLTAAFKDAIRQHRAPRCWILLDEWSGVPLDLQPFLAEMLRRLFFGLPKVTVRIGAIAHRSNFRVADGQGQYLGVEVGPELFALLDLDEFVVFPARSREEQVKRSTNFFRSLFFRHVSHALKTLGMEELTSSEQMVSLLFTQVTALNELIRAAEGVPRDALSILGRAALRSGGNKVSVTHVRQAAGQLYQSSKATSLNGVPFANQLLERINEDVISTRKARAFLLAPQHTSHELIQRLIDDRLLHLIKRNYSSNSEPGARFDVLQIDYGCYVHLLGTAGSPQSFVSGTGDDAALEAFYGDVVVPEDDYRAIRRAVLDLPELLFAVGAGSTVTGIE